MLHIATGWMYIATGWVHIATGELHDLMSDKYITLWPNLLRFCQYLFRSVINRFDWSSEMLRKDRNMKQHSD